MSSQCPEDTDSIRTGSIDSSDIALVPSDSTPIPLSYEAGTHDLIDTVALRPQRTTHLTFLNGLALVIGLQIGSGIFSAPSQVSNYVSSPALAISTWVAGGALVYTGAMAFVELGVSLPQNGGIQEYLRYAYGDFSGCVFTWTWLAISKPSAMAIISMVFSDYFCRSLLPASWMSHALEKAVALLGLAIITFINCLGIRSGALVANGFLVLKLFTLFSISLAGVAFTTISQPTGIDSDPGGWFGNIGMPGSTGSTWESIGGYITALYGVLFCYGGWESIGFVAGEIQNPSRDLPRILNTAMLVVTTGCVLFNIALYCVVPLEVIRDTKTPVVEFGTRIFGSVGGWVYSLMVATSAMGALNANVYATGRLYVSAAGRGYLPRFLSEIIPAQKPTSERLEATRLSSSLLPVFQQRVNVMLRALSVPGGHKALSRSMVANSCVVSAYIVGGTFDSLVTFVGISEYLFFLLTVAGLFSIRKRSPQNATYTARTWFLVVFCSASFFLIVRGIATSPLQGVSIGLLVSLSWLLYRYVSTAENNLQNS